MNNYRISILPSFERSLKLIRHEWKCRYHLTDEQITDHTHSIYVSIITLKGMPREYPLITDRFKLLDYPTRILVINKAYSLLYRIYGNRIMVGRIFSNRENQNWISFD